MGIFSFFNDFTARLFIRDDLHEHSASRDGPTLPASIPHMPAEIVLSILDAVQVVAAPDESNRTLASCVLVCKDWSSAAQKILFRRVSLKSMPALEGFTRAVTATTPRGRMLANTVEAFECIIDAKQPRGITQLAFAHAVLQCPRLAELSLAVYGDISAASSSPRGEQRCTKASSSALLFDDEILSLLQTGPSITALRFDNWSDNAYALSQLLEAFPSITSLNIGGTAPVLSSPTPAPPSALTQLRMRFHTSPSTEFMQWLLRSAESRLRVLEFKTPSAPQLLEDLLVEHCSTLESLALPSCASLECTTALASCTRLRALRLEDLWTASNAQHALPPALEHLAFTVDGTSALGPVIAAVEHSPSLRALTMHVWDAGARHPQLASLKMACAVQGVACAAAGSIQAFRAAALC
ncbi:hypothetical protein PHLGIDRAFT_156096 [Phlebiopsis gigantea 11061_1 CR5-6]|uniref:Uncharacterized protein n=1 Tax=Phlebiopsis gigantea (strain 11061_1 CR5-6) TaxID=745531 RepID=A0A0C3SEX7_PHLG1|nr:hypothetical protein PHLGIDRAFT_156096 [Phlebiopsis gigantea 11061_1 CR5-6]